MSKIVPNTFQCFNDYVDRAMQHLTDSEFRVLIFATRHILGWQDRIGSRRAFISIFMFANGYTAKHEDGTETTFAGCGISAGAIRKACHSLAEFELLIPTGKVTPKGSEYKIGETPNWSKLEQRTAERLAKQHKQTKKATEASNVQREGLRSTLGVTFNDTHDLTSNDTPDLTLNVTQTKPIQSQPTKPIPAPKNGADAAPTEKPKRQPNAWYDLVYEVWRYAAARNGDMQKYLRGESTKKGWKEYALETPFATPDEARAWVNWWRGQNPNVTMIGSPIKIQSSVTVWREQKSAPAAANRNSVAWALEHAK